MKEKQIRTDALLSQQLQRKERKQTIKGNCEIDYDDLLSYHTDRDQVKLENNYESIVDIENKPSVRFNTHPVPDYHDEQEMEISPMKMPSGYFQARANLRMGNVTGRYYNTQPMITSHYSQVYSTVHDMKYTRKQSHRNADISKGT